MNEVLRRSPAGKPVVFLVPMRSTAQDWNPFQVGFAGLKLFRPVRSLPIPIRAPEDKWQSVARELLSRAETVVLDASLGSESIEQEIEMIQAMGLSGKTILLSSGEGRLREKRGIPPQLAQEAQTILYMKSWYRAIPRLLLGIPASIFAGQVVPIAFSSLLMLPLGIVSLVFRVSELELKLFMARILPYTAIFLLALGASWVYGTLFLRSAVDKASGAQLSRRLREGGLASRQCS